MRNVLVCAGLGLCVAVSALASGCLDLQVKETADAGTDGGGCMPSSTVEVCGNDVDEDCDGTTCKHVADWSVRFSGPKSSDESVAGVALAASGDVLLAGAYTSAIDLGGGKALTTAKGAGAYAASLAASDGHALWIYDGTPSAAGAADGIAFDTVNNFGAASAGEVAGNGKDIFAAQFNSVGMASWSQVLSWPGDQQRAIAAIDGSGYVYVAATTSGGGTATCSGASVNLDPGSGGKALLLARLDRDTGGCTWAKVFTGGAIEPTSVALTSGYLIVAGNYEGTILGTKVPPTPGAGASGAFVLGLDTTGALQWSSGVVGVDSSSSVKAFAISARPEGYLYVTGSLLGTTDLGIAKLASTQGSEDTLVFALDGIKAAGQVLWAERFGGSGNQQGRAVAVNGSDVFIAGRVENAMSAEPNSDSGVICPGGGLFLLKLAGKDGKPAWGQCFGQGSLDPADTISLAADAQSLVLGVSRKDPIDFGQSPLSGPSLDAVVAKYALSSL